MRDWIGATGVHLPPVEEFWQLGDATGLRRSAEGQYYRSNFERGPLLYALVAQQRPSQILEFGTGRGYGTLCMARALVDHGLPGTIHTIDLVGQEQVFEWTIDWHDGRGAHEESLSRAMVWERVAEPAWLERIQVLTGTSAQVMATWTGPAIDFAFIDGDHGHAGVQHDFFTVVKTAADGLAILFDDYEGPDDFGVARLLQDEVQRGFECTILGNDGSWAAEAGPQEGHAMAWAVHGPGQVPALTEVYPAARLEPVIRRYRRANAVWWLLRRLKRRLCGR